MRLTLRNNGFPRQSTKIRAGARLRTASQLGVEDKMRCVVCGRVASVRHRLKISTKAWTVRLCSECGRKVAPLPPITELLWFQARRIDVLALASAPLGKSGRR
jgi:hypothetical protein